MTDEQMKLLEMCIDLQIRGNNIARSRAKMPMFVEAYNHQIDALYALKVVLKKEVKVDKT